MDFNWCLLFIIRHNSIQVILPFSYCLALFWIDPISPQPNRLVFLARDQRKLLWTVPVASCTWGVIELWASVLQGFSSESIEHGEFTDVFISSSETIIPIRILMTNWTKIFFRLVTFPCQLDRSCHRFQPAKSDISPVIPLNLVTTPPLTISFASYLVQTVRMDCRPLPKVQFEFWIKKAQNGNINRLHRSFAVQRTFLPNQPAAMRHLSYLYLL